MNGNSAIAPPCGAHTPLPNPRVVTEAGRINRRAFLTLLLAYAISFGPTGRINAEAPGPATTPAAEKPNVDEKGASTAVEPDETYSFHLQATATPQGYAGFHAPYSGQNSLVNYANVRASYSATLSLGLHLWKGGEVYLDPEMFGGKGISNGFGIADYTNGDVNRVTTSHPSVYLARAFYRQNFGFGGATEKIDPDQNQLGTTLDVSRLTLTLGKFSAADIFDANSYAHDPRSQFLNWGLFDNTAWDYPADIRGYTYGGAAEFNQANWAVRYGIFMEPDVASGAHLDYHIGAAFGQVAEFEQRFKIKEQPGKVRFMLFYNRAHMGDYSAAAQLPSRDITLTRRYSGKYGVGLNFEQQFSDDLGIFARLGWADGRREDWSFTEVDRTASAGVSLRGTRWSRPEDTVGVAGLLSGLSGPHRKYLAAGGVGFILGDGRLSYDAEEVVEAYYAAKLFKFTFLTADVQFINHPAFNRDRGPLAVGTIRIHFQF